jgi:hypothetical protein
MIAGDFITDLFCWIDDEMRAFHKHHPKAQLWPSEVVAFGVRHVLKEGSNQAFHRWLSRDYHPLFLRLLERTLKPTPDGFIPLIYRRI